jgi:hypothetical protein
MRLSTAANKKFQQWLYFLYYPSLGFFIERCTYRILTLKCLELTLHPKSLTVAKTMGEMSHSDILLEA